MQLTLGVRFQVRSDSEWLEVKQTTDRKEELTKMFRDQLKAILEEVTFSSPAGVQVTLDGVWEDTYEKTLNEVRTILRTPDKISITDHAREVMKGR